MWKLIDILNTFLVLLYTVYYLPVTTKMYLDKCIFFSIILICTYLKCI